MSTRTLLIAPAVLLVALAACGRQTSSSKNSANREESSSPGSIVSKPGPALSYAEVVDHASPAVITIRSERRVRAPEQFPFAEDPAFRQFFGNRLPGGGQSAPSQVEHALGSGVIVNADGYILTNHHVIDGAEDIKVDLNDHRTLSAKVVGSDPPSDLAVLKIDAHDLPVLSLADSDKVRVGDICLAVGNPLGVGQTVTAGIISARSRSTDLSTGSFEDFLQTDAPINQGNSGGALINTKAELIGINSQILSPTGGNIGIGFAIPSNLAKNVMDQLIATGKVHRGQLGVGVQPLTSDLATGLGLKQVRGVLVNMVKPGSPADRAGIRNGDVITAIDGHNVDDPNELRNRVATTKPDSQVKISFLRDGREQQVNLKVGELTAESVAPDRSPGTPSNAPSDRRLGVSVEPMTPALAQELGVRGNTQGLVVRGVQPDGPAARAGVQPGDVIIAVNRQAVRSAADVAAALQGSASRPSLLLINRGGQNMFLSVNPQ
jgi:Do/DeqQ family serine protease